MGLSTGDIGAGGLGNTSKPTTPSISAVSSTQMNIYNYNTLAVHYGTVKTGPNGQGALAQPIVLTQDGCYHNGQPMWTFHDGYYDGDYDVAYISHTGHHHERHIDSRFGSAECQGASHKLRWGGQGGSQGAWEFVTHGYISSWTTASTLNMFQIQGSGSTDGVFTSAQNPTIGGWVNFTGASDSHPYGRFRSGQVDNSDNPLIFAAGGLTGITTDGVIN